MSETLTSAQLRAARSLVGWTVRDLAEKTGIHRNTISAIEGGVEPRNSTSFVLRHHLEAAGVIFIDENGEGPGVRLRKSSPAPE